MNRWGLLTAAFVLVEGTAMAQAADPQKPGEEILRRYIAQEAKRLDDTYLAGIDSPADWRKRRDACRRELLDMIGLLPLPRRTPLNAAVTGTIDREGFVIEKLHFQSRPRLYVTGNLYRPAKTKGKLPAVLYVCGHANQGRNGNKAAYQRHGIWFATHGYVCLVIDSLQLGEIAGIHHGTYREDRWWWHSRGYCPAGVECWNCIRAIDYLQGRDDVDGQRIAVTGRSGGGAYSFWLAAADDRVQAAVPVSGLSDLEDYVKPPVINGHCDCMFLYNFHQWPWTRICNLVAPRPLLFANSDQDKIFPMAGNRRVIERLRRFYKLLGEPTHVDEAVAPGPHKDTRELRLAAFEWINRFLKGDDSPVTEPDEYPTLPGEQLRALPGELPADELNSTIDRHFVPVADVPVPAGPEELQALRGKLLKRLRETSFRAWPEPRPGASVSLGDEPAAGTVLTEDPIVAGYRYFPPAGAAKSCWVIVLNEGESDANRPDWAAGIVGEDACVLLSPRGVGPTERTIRKPFYFRRCMALLGRTMDSGRVWDVLAFLRAAKRPGAQWRLAGRGQAGIIAAYAALFEQRVAEVACVEPPASHDSGPHFLGVMRTLDIPDALGLLAPRRLRLLGTDADAFAKTARTYAAAGAESAFTRP